MGAIRRPIERIPTALNSEQEPVFDVKFVNPQGLHGCTHLWPPATGFRRLKKAATTELDKKASTAPSGRPSRANGQAFRVPRVPGQAFGDLQPTSRQVSPPGGVNGAGAGGIGVQVDPIAAQR